MLYEKTKDDYLFSNDKTKLDVACIHSFLSTESYWAINIPKETVEGSIKGSECFALYHKNKQIGFARVITDRVSFAYLADVFVLMDYRGKGLSKDLMAFIMAYPLFKNMRRFMLATKDAHSLYTPFGFKALSESERFMEIKPFESYPL